MVNKNYIRGRRIEYKAMKDLSKDHIVIRSAGSKSPFDIIALGKKEIKLIQLKSYKKRLKNRSIITKNKKELEKLKEIYKKLKKHKNLNIEFWVWIERRGFIKLRINSKIHTIIELER